jgi:hypothetical protein
MMYFSNKAPSTFRDSGNRYFRMPKRTALAVRLFAAAIIVVLSVISAVQAEPSKYPLDINVLGTNNSPNKSMLVAEGGGALTIELSTNDALGVTVFNGTTTFPDLPLPLNQIDSITSRAIGFLLFSNPDGYNYLSGYPDPGYCLDFPSLYFFTGDPMSPAESILEDLNYECIPGPVEKHLYFAIGSDTGVTQIINSQNPSEDPSPATGHSPRIPGLVILSDSGIGNLYDNSFDDSYVLASPREARNLAAYINSVGFALRDNNGKTVVTASLIAPRNLITPYIERDSNVGGSCSIQGDDGTPETLLRLNGSEQLQTVNMNPNSALNDVLRDFVIKLRIFVVNMDDGHGPLETLLDVNLDGLVDSKDAVAAGYTLLSEEKTVSLRISYTEFFGNSVDLDGNGCVGPASAPAGTGGLSRIPR